MKTRIVGIALALFVLVGIAAPQVMAQEGMPPLPPVDVGEVKDYVAALGVGSVILVAVEILKRLKVLPDGAAGRWATLANIVAFAGLAVAGVFGVDFGNDNIQNILNLLERVGQAVITIISSPLLFRLLREGGILGPLAGRPDKYSR